MATSYLTSNELNNLDNEIFLCINRLKVWKKGSNIDNIYKQIIKINDFTKISKDYLLARLATLSNEQKIKIKLLNNSASYSVNEELIDLQTVKQCSILLRGHQQLILLYATSVTTVSRTCHLFQQLIPLRASGYTFPTFRYCQSTANPCYT